METYEVEQGQEIERLQDEMTAEADLAHLLDEIAEELHALAHSQRIGPFVAIEERLEVVCRKLNNAYSVGLCIKVGGKETASALIEFIRSW